MKKNTSQFYRIIPFLFCLVTFASQANLSFEKIILNEITKMYMSSMTFIFLNQPLINQKGGNKEALFGDKFIDNIKATYQQKHNEEFPLLDHKLKQLLVQSMVEVMEDNKMLFNDEDIGFKGIIPAIFAAQLSAKLATKGIGLKIKFTRTKEDIRNVLNIPDQWESKVMAKIIEKPEIYYDEQAIINDKPAYRQFTPLPMAPYCLKCHGSMEHNPLNAGKDKEEWTNIDMTGFEMENWTLNDFGGGVSISIEKSVLE
ncbi:Tll0287-like domain-containing protein [Litorilituus lipolyticus]|uniref:DUF3365 domain-containing protein n=1 Tax=Litorilituus lipolyticus TaxID=2491017 RepID=A0A502KRS8_9GAMM|nr:DUF3365 domain-containing protein [Litorilituus lipolyticus]TPH13894.1 DUF3365 domain-containing protein [Litorilituus lipolyticus]